MKIYYGLSLTDSNQPNYGPFLLVVAVEEPGRINRIEEWGIFRQDPTGMVNFGIAISRGTSGQMRAVGCQLWEKRTINGMPTGGKLGGTLYFTGGFQGLVSKNVYEFEDDNKIKRQAMFILSNTAAPPTFGFLYAQALA